MSTITRPQRVLLAAAAALVLSACSADPEPTHPSSSPRVASTPAPVGTFAGDCAGWPARPEPEVHLTPAGATDRAAAVVADVKILYTDEDKACVDLYLRSGAPGWAPQALTVTAVDDVGREWTLTGGKDEVNDASLALSAGTGCVRFTAEVTARRGDRVAVWRAEGRSKRCHQSARSS